MGKLTTLAGSLLSGGVSAFTFLSGGPLTWALSILDTLWNSQTGRIVIIAGGTFVGTWFWCWTSEHAKIAAAVQAENVKWSQTIAKANQAAEQRIQEALSAARATTATPASKSDILRLCQQDSACRKSLKGR